MEKWENKTEKEMRVNEEDVGDRAEWKCRTKVVNPKYLGENSKE